MRRLLPLIVYLFLTGCAAPALEDSRRTAIKNVALVSAVGDKFELYRVAGGFLFQERTYEQVPLDLDRVATETARQAIIMRRPDIRFVTVDYDANALSTSMNRFESFQPFADPKRIEPALREVIRDKPVDTIILIGRARERGGPLPFEGLGIFTERTMRERPSITPFAGLSLFVIDARSMEILAKSERIVQGPIYNLNPLISTRPLGGPAPFLAGFNLPLSDEQRQFLTSPMRDLVAGTVFSLMGQAGL